MKKVFLTLLGAIMLLAGPKASGQITNIDGVWSFGGGFSMFNLSGESAEKAKNLGFETMPGFYFGVMLDYPFSSIEGFTLEPGLNIVHYGKSFIFGNSNDKKNKSYHCNYFNIPVNLKYTFPTSDSGFGLAIFTGPRLNLGVGGNSFSTGNTYPSIREAMISVSPSALKTTRTSATTTRSPTGTHSTSVLASCSSRSPETL